MKSGTFTPLRVGALARATGVSIRTLHYYDEIGLLTPSLRSDGGHRHYGAEDVERLERIISLRSLGFSLEEIGACLERDSEFSLRRVVGMHIERLSASIEQQRRLHERLQAVAARLDREESIPPEELITLIEAIEMHEKYLTKEQLADMERRAAELGPEGMRAAEEQWRVLMENVRAEMAAGSDPKSPRVQELAREWMSLVAAATGGDPAIAEGIGRMWNEESSIMGMQTAEVRAMGEYVQRALA